ncbi:MAG: glycosyltransferase family 4 protein [Chloroflexi bacterium]|nr:glycosyltransferase family 4 protein [Chloroflexota bacterium]
MTRLLYIANLRLPTEKAHGLQIMQNCEALADAGADVTLWAARRVNTPEMNAIPDPWAHYGVKRNFRLRRVPCLDLLWLVPERNDRLAQLIFHLQQWTFTLAALLGALFTRADIYYSRDLPALLALSLVKPRRALVYEAHQLRAGRAGRWLQRQVVRQVGTVITVTARLGDDLVKLGADSARLLVAHDGIRRERFADTPSRAAARAVLGWPPDAFIVGYVGRLHTMAMDKGVGTLVEALRQVAGVALALVGGPDDMAAALRRQWADAGLDEGCFLSAGQVPPERVPLYLSAFDVCAMPFPWAEHFAYYASPIKLFEYMAARRAIVASNLPSTAEVVTDGDTALLYPPGDVAALAAAITRLRDDPALRDRLAERAYERVMAHYTWDERAAAILEKVMRYEG